MPVSTETNRAWSDVLGLYLLVVGQGDGVRLRLSDDGVHPLPTRMERERAETERERAEKERLLRLLAAKGIDPTDEP